MAATGKKDERSRAEILRDDIRGAGHVFGAMHRARLLPGDRATRVLARAHAESLARAREDASEEATQAALDGNPTRAGYIEHMARRLLR